MVAWAATPIPLAAAKSRSFTQLDRANAQALVKSVLAGDRSWARCRILGPTHVTLRCDAYMHPALATRYYHERYEWQSAASGIYLNLTREADPLRESAGDLSEELPH